MHPADLILAATQEAFARTGGEIVLDVQTLLSVPVESIDGHLIRSKPGENPRAETWALHDSIEARTAVEGDAVTLQVDTDRDYAPRLQEQMDRPIFTGVGEEWLPVLVDRIAEAAGR